MPARRLRALHWRQCLDELLAKSGAIEISVAGARSALEESSNLIWRVLLHSVTENEIVVEQPMALGRAMTFEVGTRLVGIIAIGQNRWSFRSEVLRVDGGRLHVRMPDAVERCQRRDFYRMSTATLRLPEVEIWPLLDPRSVILAERANELAYMRDQDGELPSAPIPVVNEALMPEVGPRFTGTLLNIGGGGIGVSVGPDNAHFVQSSRPYWMRFNLPPELRTPICATARIAHTHLMNDHSTYLGVAFDFAQNPGHQRFVADQIARFISQQQRRQFELRTDAA